MNNKKWYQSVSNWVTIVLFVVLVPILMINISIIYQAKTNEDKVPSVFGYKPFIVLSGSMESKIHVGDLVVVKITDPATLKEGDVIAFRDAQDTVTTHRIIDLVEKDGQNYFITKGDNNSSQDQNLVEYDDVEGIYKFRIAAVGTILNALSKPTTIVIVALGITVIFILYFNVLAKNSRLAEDEEFKEFMRMKEEKRQQGQQQRNQRREERKGNFEHKNYNNRNNNRQNGGDYRNNNKNYNNSNAHRDNNKQNYNNGRGNSSNNNQKYSGKNNSKEANRAKPENKNNSYKKNK